MTKTVMFDLDGTLVDSAPSVIDAYRWVLATHGLEPQASLDRSLIGPPLHDALQRISGIEPGARLDVLATAFRERYDSVAGATTPPYPGLHEVLAQLRAAGFALLVVTNKRIVPTRLILDALGVTTDFAGVYSPDAVVPPAPDKTALVAIVLAAHDITPAESVFVGDTTTDAAAAAAFGIPFIAARYGYGDAAERGDPVAGTIDALADLPAAVAGLFS